MRKSFRILILVTILFAMVGCSGKKNPGSLSPREIVELYHEASSDSDYNTLRKIVYFPPGTTEAEINEKIGYNSNLDGSGGKKLMGMLGMKVVTFYEKILDEETAEVGFGLKAGLGPVGTKIPGNQMILKKDNGIWKIDYSRGRLTKEELIEHFKKDPQNNSWVYYYLGERTQSENRYLANKFYKKYYELEPDGFFVWEEFLENLDEWGNFKGQEVELLNMINTIPPDGGGRISKYVQLAQLCIAHNKNEKAEMYLDKASQIIDRTGRENLFLKEKVDKVQNELDLRMSGEYVDLFDELEEIANQQ